MSKTFNIQAPAKKIVPYFVITSYSIHYTKLYEALQLQKQCNPRPS